LKSFIPGNFTWSRSCRWSRRWWGTSWTSGREGADADSSM